MADGAVRTTILEVLRPKVEQAGLSVEALGDEDLVGLGIIDSIDVMNLIAEVERRTGCSFVWDMFDAEDGLSVSALATAFQAK
ncbi:acyl carrier protein [Roseomonas nepalensis]|uniref:Acyl carrier protein n=1 Tax=Muricoccus nepalensis TaxID=1854500 RepID=A0A502FIN7_9PROT|nr:acyl carrier protein [Roseomonas nepalensis]TPG49305.1 acyl carrier protein [Roseomonas nepalensis]